MLSCRVRTRPEEDPLPRPFQEAINEALEELGALVSMAGGEGDEALDVIKDAVRLPELVSNQAAAEILGQERGNAARSLRRAGIEPLYEFPSGKVYDADAVRELAARKAAESSTGTEATPHE